MADTWRIQNERRAVEGPADQYTIRNLGPDTLYYGGPAVSSSDTQLAAGAQVTVAPTTWLVSAGQSRVTVAAVPQGSSGSSGAAGVVALHSSPPDRAALAPSFTRYASNPLFDATTKVTWTTKIFGLWMIKAAGTLTSPLDTYYLYYSSDHAGDAGGASVAGIGLMTSPTPFGPFTDHGRVFLDAVNGTQSETPAVIWNGQTNLLHMYYQQSGVTGAVGVQSTCLATSPDGVTWTPYATKRPVLDIPSPSDVPGDGHTGYFVPWRVGDLWMGAGLCGGGGVANTGQWAMWYSRDGINWLLDSRLLYFNQHLTQDQGRHWANAAVVNWGGRPYGISVQGVFGAGVFTGDDWLAVAPLADDLRQVVGPPRALLYPPVGWESTDLRALNVYTEAGTAYLYYMEGTKVGVATGKAS